MIFNSPDRIAALTPAWTGPRTTDGRPMVDDDIVRRMAAVTNDEAWGVLEKAHGYHNQFEGNWMNFHPELTLTGRVVTAQMVPLRPDLNDAVLGIGTGEGRSGSQNTWVIDTLEKGDLLVVDLFGKIHDGTFIGDNLATTTRRRSGTGIIIDGGVRDYERVLQLSDFAVFCRGVDPTAIFDVTLIGVNVPIRIGHATVMPGDVALGTREGITFVPPHLAQEVVETSENVRQRDIFGKSRLADGVYSAGQIDVSIWPQPIEDDYIAWCAEQGLVATSKQK